MHTHVPEKVTLGQWHDHKNIFLGMELPNAKGNCRQILRVATYSHQGEFLRIVLTSLSIPENMTSLPMLGEGPNREHRYLT